MMVRHHHSPREHKTWEEGRSSSRVGLGRSEVRPELPLGHALGWGWLPRLALCSQDKNPAGSTQSWLFTVSACQWLVGEIHEDHALQWTSCSTDGVDLGSVPPCAQLRSAPNPAQGPQRHEATLKNSGWSGGDNRREHPQPGRGHICVVPGMCGATRP